MSIAKDRESGKSQMAEPRLIDGTLWVSFEGATDELALNAFNYGLNVVTSVSSPHASYGRIGILLDRDIPRAFIKTIADNAVRVIQRLTQRDPVTETQLIDFNDSLAVVQSFQRKIGEAIA